MPPLALDRQDERDPANSLGRDRPVERDVLGDPPHQLVRKTARLRAVLLTVVQLVHPAKRLIEGADDGAAQRRMVGEGGEVRRCPRLLQFRTQRRRPGSVLAVGWLLLPPDLDPQEGLPPAPPLLSRLHAVGVGQLRTVIRYHPAQLDARTGPAERRQRRPRQYAIRAWPSAG